MRAHRTNWWFFSFAFYVSFHFYCERRFNVQKCPGNGRWKTVTLDSYVIKVTSVFRCYDIYFFLSQVYWLLHRKWTQTCGRNHHRMWKTSNRIEMWNDQKERKTHIYDECFLVENVAVSFFFIIYELISSE